MPQRITNFSDHKDDQLSKHRSYDINQYFHDINMWISFLILQIMKLLYQILCLLLCYKVPGSLQQLPSFYLCFCLQRYKKILVLVLFFCQKRPRGLDQFCVFHLFPLCGTEHIFEQRSSCLPQHLPFCSAMKH